LAATLARLATAGTGEILVCLISKQTQDMRFDCPKAKRHLTDPLRPVAA
jgi:hypothetical protein